MKNRYIDINQRFKNGLLQILLFLNRYIAHCTKNSTQNTYIIICKYFLNWYNEIRKTNILLL